VLYDRSVNRIYVPGGRSGNLYEIDPKKGRSRVFVSGFSATVARPHTGDLMRIADPFARHTS
jgi:hypothetical protein